MQLTPLIAPLVGVIFIILLLGMTLQRFRQPQLVGYIATGVLIGPHGLGLVTDITLVEHLGALGVSLLLFFIGMEISPRQLAAGWRIALFGTLLQILMSVGSSWLLGLWLDWPLARIILIGFVISLSSTAVVLKLLADRGELESKAGRNVVLILLAQDLAVVPMLIALSFFGEQQPPPRQLVTQIAGGALILAFSAWLISREKIHLPLVHHLREDHELQVFAALTICFGMAFITGILGLSAALGAFIGGIVVGTARETTWVHHALNPLRVVFVAIFFVSVGLLVNVGFVLQNLTLITSLLIAVLLTNTFINALILRMLGDAWRIALYSGAMLAQIGEFSFVLAAVGLQAGIVTQHAYQLTIAVIAASLLFSPAWIGLSRLVLTRGSDNQPPVANP